MPHPTASLVRTARPAATTKLPGDWTSPPHPRRPRIAAEPAHQT